jgi:hypothetical protein
MALGFVGMKHGERRFGDAIPWCGFEVTFDMEMPLGFGWRPWKAVRTGHDRKEGVGTCQKAHQAMLCPSNIPNICILTQNGGKRFLRDREPASLREAITRKNA